MTYKEVADMVASIGLPYAYYQFDGESERETPFVVFFYPQSDDVYADNANYAGIRRLIIELYTDNKDFETEATVEAVLLGAGLSWGKTEQYIDTERMWQVVYEMEVIINEQ